MWLQSSLQVFSAETELHGVKHIFQPERRILSRLVWLLIFLACAVFFSYHAVNRTVSYFNYEFTTEVTMAKSDMIPLPHIALCSLPMMPMPSSEDDNVWEDITDNELVYFCNEALPFLITKLDKKGSNFILDLDNMEHMRHRFDDFYDVYQDGNFHEEENIITSTFNGSLSSFTNFLARLDNLPSDWSIPKSSYNAGVLEWVDKHKLRRDHVSSCVYAIDEEPLEEGCGELSELIVGRLDDDEGTMWTCLVVSNITFEFMESPFHNSLSILFSEYLRYMDIEVWIYTDDIDLDSGSTSYFQSVKSTRQDSDTVTTLDLQAHYRFYNLDKPYHDKPCDSKQSPSHVCMDKCYITAMNCTWYIDKSQSYFYRNGSPLPVCPLNRDQAAECGEVCPAKCYYEHHTFTATYTSPPTDGEQGVVIIGNHLVMTNVLVEEPKYKPAKILSELGGLMGLFLGASVLSVVHLFEFMGKLLIDRVCTKLSTRAPKEI